MIRMLWLELEMDRMEIISELLRPSTLIDGSEYILREPRVYDARHDARHDAGHRAGFTLTPVKFIKYDPCPAFAIIQAGTGQRMRCCRDDLFIAGSFLRPGGSAGPNGRRGSEFS